MKSKQKLIVGHIVVIFTKVESDYQKKPTLRGWALF